MFFSLGSQKRLMNVFPGQGKAKLVVFTVEKQHQDSLKTNQPAQSQSPSIYGITSVHDVWLPTWCTARGGHMGFCTKTSNKLIYDKKVSCELTL